MTHIFISGRELPSLLSGSLFVLARYKYLHTFTSSLSSLLPLPPLSIMATDTKNDKVFVIGTRRSQLALAQAYIVRDTLAKAYPDYEFKIEAMATTGDRILNVALSKIGEKSLFTKELEVALEEGRVDLVVHSLKDLPTVMEPGMMLGGVSERESPDDALVLAERHVTAKTYTTIDSLPAGAVVGTSSLRRTAQIKRKRPDLEIVSVVKYQRIHIYISMPYH